MGPITPINVGPIASPTFQNNTPIAATDRTSQPAIGGVTTGGTLAGGIQFGNMAGGGQTSAIVNMATMLESISQFLSGSQSGSDSDKTLRLLVAALFLLAVLNQMQEESQASSGGLGSLGGRSSDRSAYVGMFYSSTTISIQQSSSSFSASMTYESTSVVLQSSQSAAQNIDLTA